MTARDFDPARWGSAIFRGVIITLLVGFITAAWTAKGQFEAMRAVLERVEERQQRMEVRLEGRIDRLERRIEYQEQNRSRWNRDQGGG